MFGKMNFTSLDRELFGMQIHRDILFKHKVPRDVEPYQGFVCDSTIPGYLAKVMKNAGIKLGKNDRVIGVLGEREYTVEGDPLHGAGHVREHGAQQGPAFQRSL